MGGLNAQLEIVLPAHEMDIERDHQLGKANPTSKDCLVIEASVNSWDLFDITADVVGKVVVAHPLQIKLIASAPLKTDKLGVNRLARVLEGDLIPKVRVPPIPVRELRNLGAHRRPVIQLLTMTRKQLHSLSSDSAN